MKELENIEGFREWVKSTYEEAMIGLMLQDYITDDLKLSMIQRFFREVHGIIATVTPYYSGKLSQNIKVDDDTWSVFIHQYPNGRWIWDAVDFESYEQALQAGLTRAKEIIEKKG